MKIRNKEQGQMGFLSAKTALVTGIVLAGAIGGGAVVSNVAQQNPMSLFNSTDNSSDICVSAAYADNTQINAQRGNCNGVPPAGGTPDKDKNNTNVMISKWNTAQSSEWDDCSVIMFPVGDVSDGATIDWGDGSSEALTEYIEHDYGDLKKEVTIKVTGEFESFNPGETSAECITSVDSWGSGTKSKTLGTYLSDADSLTTIHEIPSTITSLENAFQYFNRDTSDLDVSNWDTSNVTTMTSMFSYAENLNVDLSNWDTSNVTDIYFAFNGAKNVNTGDLSKWNTSKVTDMTNMFAYSENINLGDISTWDTSNVNNMYATFQEANNPTVGSLSGWNTSNVTDMGLMFVSAQNMKIDVSKWDTSNVANMNAMFASSSNIELQGISNFKTMNVTNMDSMFRHAQIGDHNLTQWNVGKVDSWILFAPESSISINNFPEDLKNVCDTSPCR